jgi:deoxyadenosine/deoxycytidine kinase
VALPRLDSSQRERVAGSSPVIRIGRRVMVTIWAPTPAERVRFLYVLLILWCKNGAVRRLGKRGCMRYRPLIWVEGIIGAGKTTFARAVAKRLELRLIEEPVEDNPYLEKFYQDPKRYAFGMQVHLLHRRYAIQQLASFEATGAGGYGGAILDRSLSGDRVFAKLHRDAGNIDQLDWETYKDAYNIMARTLLPPTLLVFLDIQPETAFARMQKRDRKAEAGVPLDYLKKLHDGYQELLEEAESGLLPWAHVVRVCRIPWDPDTVTTEQWDRVAQTVKGSCRFGH